MKVFPEIADRTVYLCGLFLSIQSAINTAEAPAATV